MPPPIRHLYPLPLLTTSVHLFTTCICYLHSPPPFTFTHHLGSLSLTTSTHYLHSPSPFTTFTHHLHSPHSLTTSTHHLRSSSLATSSHLHSPFPLALSIHSPPPLALSIHSPPPLTTSTRLVHSLTTSTHRLVHYSPPLLATSTHHLYSPSVRFCFQFYQQTCSTFEGGVQPRLRGAATFEGRKRQKHRKLRVVAVVLWRRGGERAGRGRCFWNSTVCYVTNAELSILAVFFLFFS